MTSLQPSCDAVTHALLLPVEPRYTSLPNIMKAKKKPIEKVSADALSVDLKPRLETLKVTEPPKREGGIKVRVSIVSVLSVSPLSNRWKMWISSFRRCERPESYNYICPPWVKT